VTTKSSVPDELRVIAAEHVAQAASAAELPAPTGVEVAFAGRSNVGKSSLINCLVARKNLVRVSSTPGCTRRIGFYDARCADGARVTLVDLPGYGYAKRSKTEREAWAGLIEQYLLGRVTLRVVVVIVDVRRGIEEAEADLLDLVRAPARVSRPALSAIVVATKLDKLPRAARKTELSGRPARVARPGVGVSSVDGEGKDELWRRVRRAAGIAASSELRARR
jgi:GTP-binding protein